MYVYIYMYVCMFICVCKYTSSNRKHHAFQMASNPPPSPTSDTGGHLGAALVIIYAIGSDKKTASFLGELFCKSSKPWQFFRKLLANHFDCRRVLAELQAMVIPAIKLSGSSENLGITK